MLYDNCWAIRLIEALLLTFMSHIRPGPSPQGVRWAKSPQTLLQSRLNSNIKSINKCTFVNFYNVKASTGKQKTHSNHNVGWFSPRYHVANTPVRVEITGDWYSRGVSNLCRKLASYQYRQVLPSLAVGTWTSFCPVLMVGRFNSVVWSQTSCPQ